ncbi:hypothetical protein GCK72_018747 [Caenorhabditis remanei]|uniref:Uncharacterized protein n=1 Tax=Caenorhabditis remanei TaxID=31234 RepID=A0A6A5GC11_CAERE|nr:hypothetical protein GCK72_018747 [Caenorhabditis remanei]KAF1752193.1 hypothetical protein GCK72_018747 [Caenorhabditis remanei]
MEKTEEKEEIARQVILDVYNEDTSKLVFIALQFWDNYSDGSRHFRWIDAGAYFGCLCIMGICFSTIMFCALKIFFKLKCEQTAMSAKTKDMNRQLLLTLVFQTALPFFTMYSTVGIILTLPIFEIEVGRKGNVVASLACVYPAIEPLIAIFFVKDFRRVFLCKGKVNTSVNHFPLQEAQDNSRRSSSKFINKSLF